MPATQFKCPSCGATLKTANPLPAGKMIKCPKCTAAFPVPGDEEDKASPKATVRPKPAAVPKPAGAAKQAISKTKPTPTRKPAVADDDDWEEEDRPMPKKAIKKPATGDGDDDEPRPKKALKKRPVDEDDDDDDEPRPRKKKGKKQQGNPVLLWGLIGGGALLLIVGGVVAAVLLLGKGTTYTLKIKSHLDAGKSVVRKKSLNMTRLVKVTGAGGQVLNQQNMNQSKEEEFTETVIESGDKHPKKFKRTYEKAVQTAQGRTTTRSYEKRTVNFELRDGGGNEFYQVTVEGNPGLAAQDLDELTKEANEHLKSAFRNEDMLPSNPVKVGDTWPIDGKEMAKAMAQGQSDIDAENSKAEGKLVRVYDKDGKKFGIIEVTLSVPVKSLEGIKLEKPATLELKATVDTAIDGSSTAGVMNATWKMSVQTPIQQAGMQLTLDMNIEITMKSEYSEEK